MKDKKLQELPTLAQLVQLLRKQNEEACRNQSWQADPVIAGFSSMSKWSIPMKEFVNDADDDKFVVVQTQMGFHTLKPNLVHRHFLYRGQNKKYPDILSSFSRDDLIEKDTNHRVRARDRHIVANLKAEEFMSLLRLHPLFMMMDRGICLEPEKKPIFLNMNYYGLAQHYGFKTGLVDFTTELDVAAFFACTTCIGHDEYSPITDIKQYPTGVIYVHAINPSITFKTMEFTTIGLQLFPRSGAQKGVLFNEGIHKIPLDNLVYAYPFRHDAMVSRHFYEKMEKGNVLFPKDSISKYAQEILDRKEVPGCIFAENLYTNQDNLEQNLEALQREGMSVDWHRHPHFLPEMLDELELDLKNGLWEQFCNQIFFADHKIGFEMIDSLRRLPHHPAYAHFFDKSEYARIAHIDIDHRTRAFRNHRKKEMTN